MKGNLLRAARAHLAQPAHGAVSEHPDANLLAAFAEKTLNERERTALLRHLADCADCRETLALAFAWEEEQSLAAPARPARRWSPVWSWAASAVAISIVCSAVWEYRLQRGAIAPPPQPPAPAAAGVPGPNSSSVPPQPNKVAPRSFRPPISQPAPPRQVEPPPPPPPLAEVAPSADALRRVEARAAPPQLHYQSPGAQSLAAQKPAQQWIAQTAPARSYMSGAGSLAMARPAMAGAAMKKSAPAGEAAASSARALWTIASEDATGGHPRGIVQRSFDDGATWQTVSIDDSVSFRAVASNGSDVWAGGDDGALFRSADGGEHWQRVHFGTTVPITAIQIDADGKVYVTAGQVWMTPDGGNSWVTG